MTRRWRLSPIVVVILAACAPERELVLPVRPLPLAYVMYTSDGFVQLRLGETREVTMSVVSVGTFDDVWSAVSDESRLPEGVTVTVGPPTSLDLKFEQPATFTVELSVSPDAPLAADADVALGRYAVGLLPQGEDVPVSRTEVAEFNIEVVAADAAIGPVAMADAVGVPVSGGEFDPLSNDTAGDAPLDRASLRVVVGADDGALTLVSDGRLLYVPGDKGEDRASYEICDTNDQCDTATLLLWSPNPN